MPFLYLLTSGLRYVNLVYLMYLFVYVDQCLYGDYIGPVFSSGKTCAMAYQQNPYICLTNRKPCCQTCSPKTTTKATALSTLPTTSSSTTKVPTMTTTSTTNPTTPTTRKPTTQYTNGITKTTQLRKVTTYNAFQTQFTLPPQIAISTYYKNMIPTAPSSISGKDCVMFM